MGAKAPRASAGAASFVGRDIQLGRSSRTMSTTLNPSFDNRANQHGSNTRATTLNPSFDNGTNQHGIDTGTTPITLNPAISTSEGQPAEHTTSAADRAA
jgi:hypothetical protein